MGPEDFYRMTVDEGQVTAKKLLTAFGIKVPEYMQGAEDAQYRQLLLVALRREMHKRNKLPQYNTIDDAVNLMKKAKNIMVLTGAGISTSLGIPDFRSKGTGLYSKLDTLGLQINDPQEVFDIQVFKAEPAIFYTVAKDIIPSGDRYTPTHKFIRLLQDQGKLLTNYSQNIDNIEAKAGIRKNKLVQCHGSFATASCVKCGYQVPGEDIFEEVRAGTIPRCKRCARNLKAASNGKKRKVSKDGTEKKVRRRHGQFDSNSDSEYDMPDLSCGVMKPDITFFGEPLPDQFHDRLMKHDRDKVDLCIVIGTSLKVAPVSEVPSYLPPHVPAIYISRQAVNHINFDIDLLGDCDVVVAELCRRAGWDLEHEMIPKDQRVKTEQVEGTRSQHTFTVIPPGSAAAQKQTILPALKPVVPQQPVKTSQQPAKTQAPAKQVSPAIRAVTKPRTPRTEPPPIPPLPFEFSGTPKKVSEPQVQNENLPPPPNNPIESREEVEGDFPAHRTRSATRSRETTKSRESTPATRNKEDTPSTTALTDSTKRLSVAPATMPEGEQMPASTPAPVQRESRRLTVIDGKLAWADPR